jgi:NAD(P)-dependent dehydrogenase (short-subunit alcohol dehydrogenase family)
MPATESKVAIVTGASQGIGKATVDAMRRRGYRIVATARSMEPSRDGEVVTVAGDIGDPTTAEQIMATATERFGRVDTLVNNAGIFRAKAFTEYDEADYASMLSTNVAGFYYLTQRAINAMLQQGAGHVVTITATLADQPTQTSPAGLVALTKGGLNAVTRSLAIEYAACGIRFNAVAPGVIATPLHPSEKLDAMARMHPVGRVGAVQDIVDAILFLDDASFVTGEIVHVDGGRNAGC